MSNIDIYMALAQALGVTRKVAKDMVLRQLYGGGSNLVIAEWEVEDTAQYFRHRIVLKDNAGTVVKTSHWCTYRGIAQIDYGGLSYRACTENYDGTLPTNCVFTIHAPDPCPSCDRGRTPAGRCYACGGSGRQQQTWGIIERPEQPPQVGAYHDEHGFNIVTPTCENGTKWCTGKGEKHACDPQTAR